MLRVAVCFELCVPLSLEVGMPSFCHSFSPFIFSLRSFLSLRLSRVRGAIVCLRLVYEEHWFTREVWLARTRSVRRGVGGEKYEWIYSSTLFLPFYSQILPSMFFLSTCWYLESHFSTGVCARASVSVCLRRARRAANTGQRLIFVAGPVCIPTACRRLGGQLLLPAPFPHPGASPESLCDPATA